MENKQGQLNVQMVTIFVTSLLVIALLVIGSFVVFNSLANTATLATGQATSQTDIILSANSTSTTLSRLPLAVTSANRLAFVSTSYDGTNDLVTTPNSLNISTNGNYTYSVWVNFTGTKAPIIYLINGTNTTLYVSNGFVIFQTVNITGSPVNISAGGLNNSIWHNIIAVHNSSEATNSNISLYVDGLIRNNSLTNGTVPIGISTITLSGAGANSWNGSIDEVRVYNNTVNPTIVSQISTSNRTANSSLSAVGLQVWYPFNEDSGTTAYDISGRARNGTISGAVYANSGTDVALTSGTDYIQTGQGLQIVNYDLSWNEVTLVYTYSQSTVQVTALTNNISNGYVSFFNNIPTVFTILGAVIVILAIGIIVFVINKFQTKEMVL